MSHDPVDIERVLFAIHIARTPAKVRDVLLDRATLDSLILDVPSETADRLRDEARELSDSVGVVVTGDSLFPSQLIRRGKATVPALFYRGQLGLLSATPMVAVSGSRKVSERGAAAATRLGEIVAQEGQCLVSGSARGVDTLAATAALGNGGRSILVLPEGIARSQGRQDPGSPTTDCNQLILSQFAPLQPWTVHNAMGRNRVICGLAHTVVVVEAGESGGSLAAGREALKLGRRLLTLTFEERTPPGNKILLDEGATGVSNPEQLRIALSNDEPDTEKQGTLL